MDPAKQLIVNRSAPHVRFFQCFLTDVRHAHGERLRRRSFIARQLLLRYTTLDHISNRLAGFAVEHEDVAGFGRLDQCRDCSTIAIWYVIEGRLSRNIVVPNVMMHCLVSPALTPSFVIERYH
ncbi:hypothetical protein D3C80_1766530 [compost metagenome]